MSNLFYATGCHVVHSPSRQIDFTAQSPEAARRIAQGWNATVAMEQVSSEPTPLSHGLPRHYGLRDNRVALVK